VGGPLPLCMRSVCLAVAALLALPAQSQPHDPFGDTLDSLRQAHRIPGLAAAVVRDGETVWARGFGVAEVDEGVPVTPDTPFWVASVTKTFVGLAFLQMADDGVVRLDDRMSEVPEFDGLCTDLAAAPIPLGRGLDCDAPITVRDLLSHTAAYDRGHAFSYNPILFSRLSRYLEWTVNDSTEIEGSFNELGRQIEARVLAPAGMTRTSAGLWDRSKMDVVFDMARGYGVEDGEDGRWWWVQRPQPKRAIPGGAGVVSTALDLGRYLAALDAGTLAPPATLDALLTPPRDRNGRPLPYAVGWYVQEVDGERVAWHSGWDPEHGSSALVMWLPERRLGFAVLANGEGVWWENPLTEAVVERSVFAQVFFDRYVFGPGASEPGP
jgi:CubicO group peptidase (beta-lactamase class C family)